MISPSSGAVYGHHRFESGVLEEKMAFSALNRGTYVEMKHLIENLSSQIVQKKLPIFRIFSTFGPFFREDSELVTNKLFQSAQRGETIQLRSNGVKLRNITFIGELIAQMIHLSVVEEIDQTNPINLGTNQNLTIDAFARKIAKIYDLSLKKGSGMESFENYVPDLTKLDSYNILSEKNSTDKFIELTSGYYV
jgi:nucleoside-diphosphate-sugar epimerase